MNWIFSSHKTHCCFINSYNAFLSMWYANIRCYNYVWSIFFYICYYCIHISTFYCPIFY